MSRDAGERAAELLEEWLAHRPPGATSPPDSWIDAHPEEAEALRAAIETMRRLTDERPAAPHRAPPARIGAYAIVREIGRGGMGVVYEGRDDATGARVAVKVLRDDLARLPKSRERFVREAEIGRRVRHPNVVSFLDVGETDLDDGPRQFLVLEYVEGRSLLELVERLGTVPEALCRHIGREVAKGLAAIHAEGAVHRDIKPENVLLTSENVVKIADLGIARLRHDADRLSRTGAFVGSLPYGAPEQTRRGGADVDGRTDLHALGVTLYELATGVSPFRADDAGEVIDRVLHEVPRRAGELNPQLSPLFEDLLARLLEKDPAERPESADLVAAILDQGEASAWWKARAAQIEEETNRPLRRIKVPRETALHGRDAELAKLREAWEQAKAGTGAIVLVEGEAGIGKTRLVDEFVAALEREGEDLNFLFGSYPPGGAATASGAFSTAYREHFGAAGSRRWLPESPILVPAFDALLRGEIAPQGAEPLTKDSLQTCFVRATQSLAKDRPTVVLIDDLHFAPQEGRALFASLALGTQGHRVLLVGTARPELDPKWAQGFAHAGVLRMPLARLGAKDLVELLADALRSRHLAEELGARIALKSDGNPFFVFEILRALREGLFVTRRDDGTWIRTKEIREIQIPPSITELIQARVTGLGRDDRNLLEAASCIGFTFDAAVLADVLRRDSIEVLQDLGQIEKEHRLVRSVGREFEFDHHQVAEHLSAGIAVPLREEYHARIAESLERRAGTADADPTTLDGALCVRLCEHFLSAGRGERALRYLDAGLTHLEKGYVNEHAVRLADRALAVPGLLTAERRFDVLLRKAGRLALLCRRDAERAALDEVLALADASGDASRRARAWTSLGGHLIAVARLADAEAALRDAIGIARAARDLKGEAAATGNLGVALFRLYRYADAQAQFEHSLDLAQQTSDPEQEASASGNLGAVFASCRRFAEAQAQFERSLALAREIGDRRLEASTTGNLALVFHSLGRLTEARAQVERALELHRGIGDRLGEATVRGNLLEFLDLSAGRLDEARAEIERYLELAREVGHGMGQINATAKLGSLYFVTGRLAQAQVQYERALTLARNIGYRDGEARILVNLGSVRLRLGDLAGARRDLTASMVICREIGERRPESYALAGLAEIAEEEGDLAGALLLAEESLALRQEPETRDLAWRSLAQLAYLRLRAGELNGARAAGEEALARAREQEQRGAIACCLALLATVPGGDAGAAESALLESRERVLMEATMQARLDLRQATHNPAHLAEAKHLHDFKVEHAPPEYRETMLTNVRLHREIVAAAREAGI
jgi:serine/threonine protein kinase/Tfp pilus assembly protein PilF